jgi:hypothetical protein
MHRPALGNNDDDATFSAMRTPRASPEGLGHRRWYALPPLRGALREGRVGYEKTRLVAAHADDTTVEALIERAQEREEDHGADDIASLRQGCRTDPLAANRHARALSMPS